MKHGIANKIQKENRLGFLRLMLISVVLLGVLFSAFGSSPSALAQDPKLSINDTGIASVETSGSAGVTDGADTTNTTDTPTPPVNTDKPSKAPGPGVKPTNTRSFDGTIDLSQTISSDNPGYLVSGNALPNLTGGAISNPDRVLSFTQAADNKTYNIIQTGLRSPATNPPKQGTSLYMGIEVPAGVNITLVLSEIDLTGKIFLTDTSQTTMLIDGANYIRNGYIAVPPAAAITFDSYSGRDADDSLNMPLTVGATSNFASIGGLSGTTTTSGGDAGPITINGATITIAAASSGAGIGGGGSSVDTGLAAIYGGSGGAITINGGIVSVTQYGKGASNGSGIGGACIGGGGGGSGNSGGGGGKINITGGTVSVTQYTRGAGIGGGTFGPSGDITIDGGTITAQALDYTPGANQGTCGIGTGAGSTTPGPGSITINDGTVNVTSDWTGIGRQQYSSLVGGAPSPLDITITGGTVTSKAGKGVGVGYLYDPLGGVLTITGGTVVASSDTRSGIGGPGMGGGFTPVQLYLDAKADVTAYSGASSTLYAAITASDNTGNGSYVNTRYYTGANTTPLSASADTTLKVYAPGGSALRRTLTLPKNYYCVGYSTGTTTSRTDNIYAYNATTSTFLGSIVRNTDASPDIYSISKLADYNAHNSNANNGVLPVTLITQYAVTEKYVDVNGKTLSGDTVTVLPTTNPGYLKVIPALTDYKVVGFAVGAYTPPNYTPGTTATASVKSSLTVYFVYEKIATALTISKAVTGDYGNQLRDFSFTLYGADSTGKALPADTRFDYTGGVVAGSSVAPPPDDTLILDDEGKATFVLRSHQSITIAQILGNTQVRIVESPDPLYTVSFKDSADTYTTSNSNTGWRLLTGGARVFDFFNKRTEAPESGLTVARTEVPYALLAGLLTLPLLLLAWLKRQRQKRGSEPR
ncbi:MAG: hypothetical protein FWD65_02150 [Coriobacteriia bacterium]|nr:hypothetical protein [Coriobacteriia bacterium]